MSKLQTCLWFDDQAEAAVDFYVSLFRDGKTGRVMRYDESNNLGPKKPTGSVMAIEFDIEGQTFLALNGGKYFQLTPAVSLMVYRDTQAEIDTLWDALAAGGQELSCGWVTDRFGVTWQVNPSWIFDITDDPDKTRTARVWQALGQMKKLDLAALRAAHEGK